jgi:hypothetical protein
MLLALNQRAGRVGCEEFRQLRDWQGDHQWQGLSDRLRPAGRAGVRSRDWQLDPCRWPWRLASCGRAPDDHDASAVVLRCFIHVSAIRNRSGSCVGTAWGRCLQACSGSRSRSRLRRESQMAGVTESSQSRKRRYGYDGQQPLALALVMNPCCSGSCSTTARRSTRRAKRRSIRSLGRTRRLTFYWRAVSAPNQSRRL